METIIETKICRFCSTSFDITDKDLEFYDKVSPTFSSPGLNSSPGLKFSIPSPTLCPDCREQRRLSFRNERNLYKRKCDLCDKNIISVYAPDKEFIVYCQKCWWSDRWDPRDYCPADGFDFQKSFFEQFQELYKKVPQLAIQNDNGVGSENCEYCQDFAFGKNCYLVTGSWYLENSLYTSHSVQSKEIVDCVEINIDSELVYESISCQNVYHSIYLQNSENCRNCYFGYDLKGCEDCFCCFGLRNKKYHILNKSYSKEEYKEKIKDFKSGSYKDFEKTKLFFFDMIKKIPHKNMNLSNCEDSEGNFLINCKDVQGFDVEKGENCKFYYRGDSPRSCYDIHQSGNPKYCYEGLTIDDSYKTLFSIWCWKDKNVIYSDNCHSSEYLFGCSSLKRAQYCILNKQYTKEEYESLVPKIIEHMQTFPSPYIINTITSSTNTNTPFIKGGRSEVSGGLGFEWGEFFPSSISPFGYNESVAQEAYPINKTVDIAAKFNWYIEGEKHYNEPSYVIPDNISDITDDIIQKILVCSDCRKNYKIIPQELDFYKKMILPLPKKCYNCRNLDRLNISTPLKLWNRVCDKCGIQIKATYSPDREEIVYCDSCYEKQVYN